jgi:transposase
MSPIRTLKVFARATPKACHGKNKQKRNDCPQVAIGMAFDEHGLPLAHEVFEGNIADI